MEGRATIDEKPVSLILNNVPRACSGSIQQNDMPLGQPGFPIGYSGYPGYAPPIFVLPPQWGPQGGTNSSLPSSLPLPQGTGTSGSGQLLTQSRLSVPVP